MALDNAGSLLLEPLRVSDSGSWVKITKENLRLGFLSQMSFGLDRFTHHCFLYIGRFRS